MLKTIGTAALLSIGAAGLASADEIKVNQVNKAFDPVSLTVKAGDTVDFVNGDTVTHNVYTRGTPQVFSLGALKPGEQKSVTFSTPGTYDVKCAIHPTMKMTITVQ
jgi:plastocyanin